jgi:hypothetical protein
VKTEQEWRQRSHFYFEPGGFGGGG